MNHKFADARSVMQRAIELASRGIGFVEPNPAVGAVIVDDGLNLLGEGFHRKFGGPHAEVEALRDAQRRSVQSSSDAASATASSVTASSVSGASVSGATMYVTLEPCCHQGKTPPCTQAIINAKLRKVVVGMRDPSPHADGTGIAQLEAAGIAAEVGLLTGQVKRLNAPFLKRVATGLPYVHAKWAMTLDGKIASRTGVLQWISNAASREIVHRLRGRVDAVVVGSGTALQDDPLLTARPPGARVATRIVADNRAELPLDSQLVRTVDQAPVIVAAGPAASEENVRRLLAAGVEVLRLPSANAGEHSSQPTDTRPDLRGLLAELGRRDMTNVLVEGGSGILGALFDRQLCDEVHVFVAPKIVGGASAKSPVAGIGLDQIPALADLQNPEFEIVDDDVYIHGALRSDS